MNLYSIYLTVDGMVHRLPVNPPEITIDYPQQNQRYNILGLGEVVQARAPGLRTIAWKEGLLPGTPDGAWVLDRGQFRPPSFYIDLLNRCKEQKLVCTLTLDRRDEAGTSYRLDAFQVLLEEFALTEKGGETGDFSYDVSFCEYRSFLPITSISDPAQVTAAQPQRPVPPGQLVVGTAVTVNGRYYTSSYGAKPFGEGNGRRAVVSRMVADDPSRPYPIHVSTSAGGALGWCAREGVTAL